MTPIPPYPPAQMLPETIETHTQFAAHVRTGAPCTSPEALPVAEVPVVDAEHPPEGYRLAAEGDPVHRATVLVWTFNRGPWVSPSLDGDAELPAVWSSQGGWHPMAVPIEPAPAPLPPAEDARDARIRELEEGIREGIRLFDSTSDWWRAIPHFRALLEKGGAA